MSTTPKSLTPCMRVCGAPEDPASAGLRGAMSSGLTVLRSGRRLKAASCDGHQVGGTEGDEMLVERWGAVPQGCRTASSARSVAKARRAFPVYVPTGKGAGAKTSMARSLSSADTEKMFLPFVLTMSGSSTPASWTLVREKSSTTSPPSAARSCDIGTGAGAGGLPTGPYSAGSSRFNALRRTAEQRLAGGEGL